MTIRWRFLGRGIALGALLAVAARGTPAQPPVAQPLSVRHGGDARFATLEHEYVTYVLAQFPVVATYLASRNVELPPNVFRQTLFEHKQAAAYGIMAEIVDSKTGGKHAGTIDAVSSQPNAAGALATASVASKCRSQPRKLCAGGLDSSTP